MSFTKQNNLNQQLPAGLTIQGVSRAPRVPRKPQHSFHVKQYPYELTPFMIAPVLAGETLKNLLLQCRTVTSPLENKIIGHHLEHYFFYVKLRDLADSADIVTMLMDLGGTSVNLEGSNLPYYNVLQNAPAWLSMCTTAVVKHYFRDEGDTASHVGSVTGLPMVYWENRKSIGESLIDNAVIETGTITSSQSFPDHEEAYQAWEFMRQMQLTEMSFEDYLETFGIRMSPAERKSIPELIRYIKNWTYPTNTVDGEGNINSQAVWSVQERADKDRLFKEPGFIVGYTVHKPKLYLASRSQAAVSMLNDAISWLPAVLKPDPSTSLKKFAGSSALLPFTKASTPSAGELDSDNSYWVDIRDLFIYGDQFTNLTLDGTINAVRAENLADFFGKKLPQSAALQTLGIGDVLTTLSDGVVSLNVLGTQVDMT